MRRRSSLSASRGGHSMSIRQPVGRDMQTRNGDLVITDQVRSIKHAWRLQGCSPQLGTTTEKGMRQQLGVSEGEPIRTEEAEACEQSRLSMPADTSAGPCPHLFHSWFSSTTMDSLDSSHACASAVLMSLPLRPRDAVSTPFLL
jgi:hypothetical protein